MLSNPKFDLKLVATRKNGEQLELVRSFTLADAENKNSLLVPILQSAMALHDDLEKFVADEKAKGGV